MEFGVYRVSVHDKIQVTLSNAALDNESLSERCDEMEIRFAMYRSLIGRMAY